uniref:Far11/STRP N-terminal domain-containing protein n=1 Tax=Malurus cyaneus samueli TaxID=2593467 RepID=A0A8C5TPR2_9PASS
MLFFTRGSHISRVFPRLFPAAPGAGSVDCPNLEFEYGDTDGHGAELAELYSYTEEPERSHNRRCFEEDFHTQVPHRRWPELDGAQQKAYVMRLLDGLEVVNRDRRLRVARAILYLAQGVFGDCSSEEDVLHWSRHNSFLLYQLGTFSAFLELLNMEIDRNSQACSSALRKPAISLADSTELRVLLSVMYLLVENIRVEQDSDPPEWRSCRETFRTELSFPVHSEEPFALLLFTMVTKFCSGHAPHFPMKKVLLLLWKVLLFSLGGFEALQSMKVQKRQELGLPALPEDSIQVVRGMRAASPPAYPADGRGIKSLKRFEHFHPLVLQPLMKQDSLDMYNERDPFKNDEGGVDEEDSDDVDSGIEGELDLLERDSIIPTMPAQRLPIERVSFPKGLPWAPKLITVFWKIFGLWWIESDSTSLFVELVFSGLVPCHVWFVNPGEELSSTQSKPIHKLPIHKLPICKLPKLPIHQLPIHQLAIHQLPIHQLPIHKLPINQLPIRKSVNCQSINCQSINCQSVNCQSINCQSVNCQSINCQSINCQSVNCQSVNCQSINCQSINC